MKNRQRERRVKVSLGKSGDLSSRPHSADNLLLLGESRSPKPLPLCLVPSSSLIKDFLVSGLSPPQIPHRRGVV